MNPAYRHARFRAELPRGGLPQFFAVITACNPDGRTISPADNDHRTRQLQAQLIQRGLEPFAVTGFDPRSPHEEAGFGVLCDLTTAYDFAEQWDQEAFFWVHRGRVSLIGIGPQKSSEPPQRWADMTETPAHHPRFHFWGPLHLLGKPTTAFLCSTRCPAEKVAEIYQWARQQCEVGGTVISGFHTPVEQDVLGILVRRGANALWVPARSLPKSLPKHLQPAFDEGGLTILSPYDYGTHPRASRATGSLRNGFVLDFTRSHYLPHIAPGSALAADAARQAP